MLISFSSVFFLLKWDCYHLFYPTFINKAKAEKSRAKKENIYMKFKKRRKERKNKSLIKKGEKEEAKKAIASREDTKTKVCPKAN